MELIEPNTISHKIYCYIVYDNVILSIDMDNWSSTL